MSCLISKAPASVTQSVTEAQSPCVSQLSVVRAGVEGSSCSVESSPATCLGRARKWAQPLEEPGDPARNVAASMPALCGLQASLFPLGVAGNCFSVCCRRWCLQKMPEAWASVVVSLSTGVGPAESGWTLATGPGAVSGHIGSAFNCCKLWGIWDHLTQGLQTVAYGPILACSLFL